MNNPLFNISEAELKDYCRHKLDTFENWSRRLIDEALRDHYGDNYFDYLGEDNQPLVKSEIKRRVEDMTNKEPGRYPRKIDGIYLDDIGYFFCKNEIYDKCFKSIFEQFYSGNNEIRNVIKRLVDIRNKLSHGTTISIHEAEQCICYTDDLIELLKKYYRNKGKEREYNVPLFLRFKDSLGNDIIRKEYEKEWEIHFNGYYGDSEPVIKLRAGECYKLWVEVDSSFDSSFYDVRWRIRQIMEIISEGKGTAVEFFPNNTNVSYSPKIEIMLITKRDWHRFQKVDDIVSVSFADVLPPIEDSY